ncbi:MAG TPA: double-strand break repair helicase AddA [Xanthobacteraceae bacterium]|jgi:ATP-dependent helicase/nuclease subunit A
MRKPDHIPPQVRDQQRAVADPSVSAWVAANAGSGKTHVLAQRVINLLLKGVEPEKILCITFTKAAAANMAKRVFDTLAQWTTLDDAALDDAIRERSNLAPDARRRALARRLFARALETPGGLKVHTIHAFCTQLLHQFPFEANVAARFTVLDDSEQTQLLEDLTLHVLLDGAREPDGALGHALASAMTAAADQTFRDVVRAAIGRRDAISRWVTGAEGVDPAIAGLSRALGLDPKEDIESVEDEFFSGSAIATDEWAKLAAALMQGGKTDADQARRFNLLASLSRADRVETYLDIFCTASDRTPRKSVVTKSIKDAGLVERLIAEQHRVCALLERKRAVICRDRSAALLTVTHEVLIRYQSEKGRRGLVDYDDLIDKTLELLTNVDAAWVHYKLDLGINHLLIDEAQDTSSKQWQIVRQLVAEFTAGAGARAVPRTIFAVGDEKQSIYSFQNAAPKEFAEMRRHFQRAHDNGGLKFVFEEFKHSFRSGENVLAAVDEVFKNQSVAASVSSDSDGFPPHIALPDAAPSLVEIWEPAEPDERQDIEGWQAPFDLVSETSPRVKLARRIARAVRRMVDGREPVGIERRAVRYGDILILVRQRGELFEAIIRALKQESVEVAGADRLVLAEHIAVMDLMALADALLLPQDDLALATVLRSPLFSFTDEDLFAVAWGRGGSLRDALLQKAAERALFAEAAAFLDRLAEMARRETPFAFYAQILGAGGGRRRFLARLGAEANDALDEFLNLAFDYERRVTPSLQGFVAWLRAARAEVKRDMEIARDEVRVMTVHGAKGLEAPIVILADTITPPAGPKQPRLLPVAGNAVVWAGRKADDPPPVAAARQQALDAASDEYRRLLYVAMTRAADRLIVAGANGRNKRPDGCWYDLVRTALEPFLVEETDGDEKVLRYRKSSDVAAQRGAVAASDIEKAEPPKLPSWLRESAPAEARPAEALAPSSVFDEEIGRVGFAAASIADRRKALQRGRIVHRLMQALPDIPPERRQAATDRYLASAAMDFSEAERAAMATQMFTILGDARFAEVFTPGSRPEVPIVGRIARAGAKPILVTGQVDRLIVTADAVLIADYKTDSYVPQKLDEVRPYVTQLALYRAVLARLYPGKARRAALIFTTGPVLKELPADILDAALSEVVTKSGHAAVMAP